MARGTARKRKAFQRTERQARVAELYFSGKPQYEIARLVGVDNATITRDLDVLHQGWLERHAEACDARAAEDLAKIDHLEAEAWVGYERSCRDAEMTHVQTIDGRTDRQGNILPSLKKASRTIKGQAGDPRFLERISWCIETRLKLVGALKHTNVSINFPVATGDNSETSESLDAGRQRLYTILLARLGNRLGTPASTEQPFADHGSLPN